MPLIQDSPLDSLSINYGLNDLKADAFAAIAPACEDQIRIEGEIARYVDQVKYVPPATAVKVCTGWCSITNWSTYPWNYTRWDQCINSKSALQAKVNALLLNPYSAQVRQDFLSCTGLSLPEPSFGA